MPTEKEILQIKYDKAQYQFALDGTLIINQNNIDDNTPLIALINENKFYICPFCLEKSNKYLIENKGLIKCPNCLVCMKLKTLLFIQDCTNEDYAKWVFEYRLSGFFSKLKSGENSFEKWNQKMKELGIAYEFWNKYMELKGEYEKEDSPDNLIYEDIQKLITAFIHKINNGSTKEQLTKELFDFGVNVSDENIDYCYNEALARIKNKVV